MMKTKYFKTLTSALIVVLTVICSVFCAGAEESVSPSSTAPTDEKTKYITYTNPETKFNVLIRDDCDLLTEQEEKSLTEDMKPLTEFVNAVCFTTDAYSEKELQKFTEKAEPPLSYDDVFAAVFDLKSNQMWQYRDGKALSLITKDEKRLIFDAASGWQDNPDKYAAIKKIFAQAEQALSGESTELVTQQVEYDNPETGYRAVILDEDDLLTDEEELQLIGDMKPITEYGNAAFWSTGIHTSNEIDQARQKRKELFGFDSAVVFAVNMSNRKLTIQSIGKINEFVTDSKARSITDNVKSYASSKEYYTAAKEAFSQMYNVILGENIPEPMKYASYAVLALIIGLIATLAFVFSKRANPLTEDTNQFAESESADYCCRDVKVSVVSKDTEPGLVPSIFLFFLDVVISTGGSGGGGSSGGFGGFGGGSSGGGSSGGGGGGCGSGGSASF